MKKLFIMLLILLNAQLLFSVNLIPNQKMATNQQPKISTSFLQNQGQWNPDAKYLYNTSGLDFWICKDAFYIDKHIMSVKSNSDNWLLGSKESEYSKLIIKKGTVIKFELIGANNDIEYLADRAITSKTNFMLGNNPDNRITNIGSFSKLSRHDIYPGIDIQLTIENEMPRYDFIVHPGADIKKIKLSFSGQNHLKLSNQSDRIELKTKYGTVYTGKLFAYQEIGGRTNQVDCKFVKHNKYVGFKLGDYDKNYPLIIDPKVYSSYFGGSGDDEITSSVLDNDNNLIVCGWTNSTDLKTTPGTYDTTYNNSKDIFVAKYSLSTPDKVNIFTTYLGGGLDDIAYGIDVDPNGNIYVTGESSSTNYPTQSGVSTMPIGKRDIILTKLNPDGSKIIYSTYIGGENDDYAYAISVGESGAAYICGGTSSNSFPKTTSYDIDGNKGREEAFVLKLSPSGSTIGYAALLTTTGLEHGTAIAADESQSTVIMCGITDNSRFYTVPNSGANRVWDRYYNGSIDGFITKFGTSGAFCEFAGFYGGPMDDYINAVCLESDGSFYISGKTNSTIAAENPTSEATSFPLSSNAYAPKYKGGSSDAFLAKFDKKCNSLLLSTYFGGVGDDSFTSIVKNKLRNSVYLTGYTSSSDYPIVNDQTNPKPSATDAMITEINSIGTEVYFSTVFGGGNIDIGNKIILDNFSDLYVTGSTTSKNFPVTQNGLQGTFGGGTKDGFIYKYTTKVLSLAKPAKSDEICAGTTTRIEWSATGFQLGEKFTIQITTDDGNNWTDLVKDVTGLEYDWKIPKYQPENTNYSLRIAHASGLVAETGGHFTILSAPSIQSINAYLNKSTYCEGDSAIITVMAQGKSKAFQWRRDGKDIANEKDSVLVLHNITIADNGKYDVRVSGKCSPDTISGQLSITVIPATKITGSFDDMKVKLGKDAVFTVLAKGSGNKYEWQHDKNKILGYTDSIFTINNVKKNDSGYYRCIVTGDCGSDTTREALLTIDDINSVDEQINNPYLAISATNAGKRIIINLASTKEQNLKLSVIDNNGNSAAVIFDGHIGIETKEINYDINRLSTGVYWIIAQSGNLYTIKKELIVK